MRLLKPVLALHLLLALACGRDSKDTVDSPQDTEPTGGDVDSEPLTADDMPADPSPITITFSGSLATTLTFDQPTCSSPVGSTNLRVFWRGSHPTVLRMDILGAFTGPGTYTQDDGNINVVLQDEAGGSGNYFPLGDGEVTIEVLYKDDDVAWGSYTVTGLNSTEGNVTLEPSTIPIWCSEFI